MNSNDQKEIKQILREWHPFLGDCIYQSTFVPFFVFRQNNSGGSFITNEKLCSSMIIQAFDKEEAIEKFIDLGGYFDGVEKGVDCECCGDRWYKMSIYRIDTLDEYNHISREVSRIFYMNGEIEPFYLRDQPQPKPSGSSGGLLSLIAMGAQDRFLMGSLYLMGSL